MKIPHFEKYNCSKVCTDEKCAVAKKACFTHRKTPVDITGYRQINTDYNKRNEPQVETTKTKNAKLDIPKPSAISESQKIESKLSTKTKTTKCEFVFFSFLVVTPLPVRNSTKTTKEPTTTTESTTTTNTIPKTETTITTNPTTVTKISKLTTIKNWAGI